MLRLFSLILILAVGCASKSNEAGDPSSSSKAELAPSTGCTEDADCGVGFCDHGTCAAVVLAQQYGQECDPESSLDVCQGYSCVKNRCRSCTSDADCGGEAVCGEIEGRPGRRCGSQAGGSSDQVEPGPTPPPPTQPTANP